MKSKLILLIGLILFITSCQKDDTSSGSKITGTIKNIAGEPIEGVMLTCGDNTSTSLSDGTYEITGVADGDYTFTANKNGYKTYTSPMTFTKTVIRTFNVVMHVPSWTGTYFSGGYAVNFTATGASLGFADEQSDMDYDGSNVFTPNHSAGILDLGPNTLNSIGTVPSSGYQQYTKAYAGNVYALITKEGNYCVFKITQMSSNNQEITFDWKYQSNGGTQF